MNARLFGLELESHGKRFVATGHFYGLRLQLAVVFVDQLGDDFFACEATAVDIGPDDDRRRFEIGLTCGNARDGQIGRRIVTPIATG